MSPAVVLAWHGVAEAWAAGVTPRRVQPTAALTDLASESLNDAAAVTKRTHDRCLLHSRTQ